MEKLKTNTLSNPNHETIKIPDFILLKSSREENAKLQQEILRFKAEKQELEDKCSEAEKNIKTYINDAKLTKREALYVQMKTEHIKICKKLHQSRQDNEKLIAENIQLRLKLKQ